MSVPSGQCYIINSTGGNDNIAGRNMVEDLSLNPKRVCCPAQGFTSLMQETAWEIVSVGNGTYQLKNKGAVVGVQNGLLYAYLITEQASSQAWIITAQPQHGPNQYTIETADRQTGWVVQPGRRRSESVAVRPLIVQPSFPPRFPPTELWTITPVQD
ncbi:hypothetical protein BT96DRAFT_924990 [Gymnopus androsaceus JB14]|uniref:Ricin B lectin domain-containing protein n=1 Tax=Gymnopus androsaceus JB14 TaxID=1447944 RepID=A0A6A4H1N0_9AGAR|nr:hypothetical protein BT96DRAFT_924990 [Gymnopus androsaceus JB14]